MNNFSEERFSHILEVGKYIYPKKQRSTSTSSGGESSVRRTSEPQRHRPTPTFHKDKKKDDTGKYLVLAGALALGVIVYIITKK